MKENVTKLGNLKKLDNTGNLYLTCIMGIINYLSTFPGHSNENANLSPLSAQNCHCIKIENLNMDFTNYKPTVI